MEVIRKACECDFVVKRQQKEFFWAHSGSFVDCAAAVWLQGLLEDLLLDHRSVRPQLQLGFSALTPREEKLKCSSPGYGCVHLECSLADILNIQVIFGGIIVYFLHHRLDIKSLHSFQFMSYVILIKNKINVKTPKCSVPLREFLHLQPSSSSCCMFAGLSVIRFVWKVPKMLKHWSWDLDMRFLVCSSSLQHLSEYEQSRVFLISFNDAEGGSVIIHIQYLLCSSCGPVIIPLQLMEWC